MSGLDDTAGRDDADGAGGSDASDPSAWGRVETDGTVLVRTADGERVVGQYPEGTPEEALAFYVRRFASLEVEVDLLVRRVKSGVLAPRDAQSAVRSMRAQVAEASAVGDLGGLAARLDELGPLVAAQRDVRRSERAAKVSETTEAKERLVADAEKIAAGTDWRHGSQRLRDLLEQWKELPRIDKAADNALWKRFSGARTTYSRARKTHAAAQDEKREQARVVKQRLATEAEALASSTDWGATAGRYRDLMREWKAAGPAPRGVDDKLWARFRGAQDTFFGARDAANEALDAEFAANAEVKDALIVEAEALVPVTDLAAAKRTFRDLAERWDAAGKVPRARVKELEGRMRAVEQAIRAVEDRSWSRSDPEKSARADGMISQLEATIADLEQRLARARDDGDDRAAARLEDDLASRRSFLDMARRASADFGG